MAKRSRRFRAATRARLAAEQAETKAIREYPVRVRTYQRDMAEVGKLIDARKARVNASKGLNSAPYDDNWRYVNPKPGNQRKARAARLKGYVKWQHGEPTLCYVKSGYAWVNGERVKVDPNATGVTQTFGTNRATARAEAKALAKKRGQRAKNKAKARSDFERVSTAQRARAKQLKLDRAAERAKALLHQAAMAVVDSGRRVGAGRHQERQSG